MHGWVLFVAELQSRDGAVGSSCGEGEADATTANYASPTEVGQGTWRTDS